MMNSTCNVRKGPCHAWKVHAVHGKGCWEQIQINPIHFLSTCHYNAVVSYTRRCLSPRDFDKREHCTSFVVVKTYPIPPNQQRGVLNAAGHVNTSPIQARLFTVEPNATTIQRKIYMPERKLDHTLVSGRSPSATTGTPRPRSGLCSTSCSCFRARRKSLIALMRMNHPTIIRI